MNKIKNATPDWQHKKLKHVCQITTGNKDVNEGSKNGTYPFFTCAKENSLFSTFSFEGDSILIAGNGNFSVKKFSGKFEAYQRTYVLQNFTIDYKFLFYNLLGHLHIITKGNRGSTIRYIRIGDLTEYDLYVPPKQTQLDIVTKIEELFSELDKGIETLLIARQQLKTYRQTVLKWALEGRLTNENVNEGELPKGWQITNLGDFIENISSGKSYRCNERPPNEDEVGIVKVSSVTWGFFDEMQSKTCFSNDFLNIKYLIKQEDFLFSRANTLEFIGACVIVKNIEKTLMLSDKILRFVFSNNVSKEFVLYYLRSKKGRKQIETLSTGNQDSMRNIGQEKIRNIEFPYCSLNEQKRIVQEIQSRLSVADKMEESITQSLQQAEGLRQSILKKAFEGKLIT